MPKRGGDPTDMTSLRILHAADLHLDSPFEGLGAGKAAVRRKEQRELLGALAELAAREQVDLVLLAGDLLDSDGSYAETGEELVRCLRQIQAPVFIAPGNHDCYTPASPYARLRMPDNVHIFRKNAIEAVELPGLQTRVYGAAFTEKTSGPLLRGFRAPRQEGLYQILCLHGEVGGGNSRYDPITPEELAGSGLDYAALGHIHKASGLLRAGDTWYSWPGCPEGRGFDETGEKTVSLVTLTEEGCTLETRDISLRRYEKLCVDVTGTQTEIGESRNKCVIVWDNANVNNYTVSENLGTLTVKAPAETVNMRVIKLKRWLVSVRWNRTKSAQQRQHIPLNTLIC